MPRNRTPAKKRRGKRGNPAGKGRPTPGRPNVNIDDVLVAAHHEMSSLNLEQAAKLYTSAASLLRMGQSPTLGIRQRHLLHVLEKLAEIKVGSGDQEGAMKHLTEALTVLEAEYSAGTNKDLFYFETKSTFVMYLGQLCSEEKALEAYQAGIQCLETCIKLVEQQSADDDDMEEDTAAAAAAVMSTDDDDNENANTTNDKAPTNKQRLMEFKQQLSGAYCTAAELYLTDLCFADQAEQHCESLLQRALEIKDDTTNQPFLDALQTMASLRLSQQGKQHEAVGYMLQAFQGMQKGCDALASLVGLTTSKQKSDDDEEALELKEVEAASNLPEFEFRCQSAKLLLECAGLEETSTKDQDLCTQAAISILGSLLAQNDEVIEIWYLTGCAFCATTTASRGSKIDDSARYYLTRAMEMLMDTQKSVKEQQQYADDDEEDELEEQLEELACQIEDVQAKLDELGPGGDDDDEDDDGADEADEEANASAMEE
eukprot:CAMPEP_0119552522 /NCGR_PEP_ID=MMETSP1352-20130426/5481_1 /TAXON_ID=265584 /ORGANISM="Stauroneis constricta, Strain CCMP1120" /LENGTH=485 /DNA_ID=CAMNT_0007598765 /DNA_START=14 /DNA_END=1471 /DNA_ORIENTATION=+